jgi:hypothetical protein
MGLKGMNRTRMRRKEPCYNGLFLGGEGGSLLILWISDIRYKMQNFVSDGSNSVHME